VYIVNGHNAVIYKQTIAFSEKTHTAKRNRNNRKEAKYRK